MTQRQIDAAYRRSLKPTYRYLRPPEKRLVQAQRRIDVLERNIAATYRLGQLRYGPNFRKDPRFQEDFELIYAWEEEVEKLMARISRLEAKYDLQRDQVMALFQQVNRDRCYGGSF
ncbi:MAG: hypothetical protein KKA73_06460 [Chloroflexi bacterium]|nr:hypothetical protein [Chloroflexota bacterium]MBU1747313.1 hypothetical protein [Chloroflexota bacterium]